MPKEVLTRDRKNKNIQLLYFFRSNDQFGIKEEGHKVTVFDNRQRPITLAEVPMKRMVIITYRSTLPRNL